MDDQRQQYDRLAISKRLDRGHDREFGQIVGLTPHHRREHLVDRFDLGEVEYDGRTGERARLQRRRMRVAAQNRAQMNGLRHVPSRGAQDRDLQSCR